MAPSFKPGAIGHWLKKMPPYILASYWPVIISPVRIHRSDNDHL